MKHIVLSSSVELSRETLVFVWSFNKHHQKTRNDYQIHILSYDLPDGILDRLRRMDPKIIIFDLTQYATEYNWSSSTSNKVLTCFNGRIKYASTLDGIVMISDVDYFWVSNTDVLFDLASLGYVVGPNAGFGFDTTLMDNPWRLNHKCKAEFECRALPIPDGYEDRLKGKRIKFLAFPYILDVNKYRIVLTETERLFYYHRFKALKSKNSLDFIKIHWMMNNMITAYVPVEKIYPVPPHQLGGIRNNMVLFDTGIFDDDGILVARDYSPVYMVHGRFFGGVQKCYNSFLEHVYNRKLEDIKKACKGSVLLLENEYAKLLKEAMDGSRYMEM